MPLDKSAVKQILEGYRRADEITFRERTERLRRLMPEEARREFDMLCATWYSGGVRRPLGDLDKQRLSFLLERRRRLNALWARWRG